MTPGHMRRAVFAALVVVLLVRPWASGQRLAPIAPAPVEPAHVSDEIRRRIERGDPAIGTPAQAGRAELKTLYESGGYEPIWLGADGRPDRDAREALGLLERAAEDGLDPAGYHQSELSRLAAALARDPRSPAGDVAAFDVGLSAGTLRYLRDLHLGRVDPRAIGFRLTLPADHHDFAVVLRAARADHRIAEIAAGLRPPLAQYAALRAALARYRVLAADETLDLPPAVTVTVRPGDEYGGAAVLRRQLAAFGDLPPDAGTTPDASRYDGTLVDGLKRFQLRHGLKDDGAIGKGTLAALRVPLARRVRQIELALERLRWLPHLGDQRLIVINIPMFRLWAWDAIPADGPPAFAMDVIVGRRALSTRTPVFVEQMREVIFRPYWNVPPSILRHEILPQLERDPDYLRRQRMEIVRGPGDDATPEGITAESIAALRQGTLRVRQQPGPGNSLGLVKFVFPNDEAVYMHGTPLPQLFAQSSRDFSHGCVRVADPIALAEWVLQDQDGATWGRDRILAATAGSQPLLVKLAQPIQVILFYTTAAVMPEDGAIRFADDIYGHDARLDRVLASGGPAR